MTDTGQFSDAIGTLYDSILEPARWTEALEKLSNYVGGSSALLFHQDHRLQTGQFLKSYNADPQWTRLYFEKYVGLNPVLPLTTFMEAGSCTSFSQLIDMDEFRASQFYLEWAAPQRYLDVVVTIIDKSASAMGMFGVTRMDHEGLAGEAEIGRMKLVAPHVRRAVTMARLFDGIRGWTQGLKDSIDILSEAVFLLNPAGKVVFANSAARAMATADSQIDLSGDNLSIRDKAASDIIRDGLARMVNPVDAGERQVEFLLGGSDPQRLIAHLIPLSSANRRQGDREGAVAALFVRPVMTDAPPPMEMLARLHGLTPKEIQVFVGILQFGGVPEVARIFGLAPTTVRTHLQSIFDKTGVRRQADLARLAASAMPPGRQPAP